MTSRLAPFALLVLAACGSAADAPPADDESPPSISDESAATPARASSPRVELDALPEVATASQPIVEPSHVEPLPAPAPTPAPQPIVEPVPAPVAEEPTPEEPLIIDCRADAHGCSDCSKTLRVEHPEWYESGAAACQLRDCSADSDCTSLGADLVCRHWSQASDQTVCRLPRLELQQLCDSGDPLACEVGLSCQPSSPARCRPLP